MNITVICVGRLKDKFYEDASAEYLKRLSGLCKMKVFELPAAPLPEEPNSSQIEAGLKKEAEQIIKKIPKGARVYPLCIEGEAVSSEQLAKITQAGGLSGVPDSVFIIGGSYGLDESVKALAAKKISMSKMTFPHRLARIMLFEQIYRALMINAGSKYHK